MSQPYHDERLKREVTALDRLKAWNLAGQGVMGFCDVENCIGKQPTKRIEPGVFVCKTHFFAMVK